MLKEANRLFFQRTQWFLYTDAAELLFIYILGEDELPVKLPRPR